MDEAVSTVHDLVLVIEHVARPPVSQVFAEGLEGAVDATGREGGEVAIDIEVVQAIHDSEHSLRQVVVEYPMHPTVGEESATDLHKVITMGEGRLLLAAELLDSLNDARAEGRERIVDEFFKCELYHMCLSKLLFCKYLLLYLLRIIIMLGLSR